MIAWRPPYPKFGDGPGLQRVQAVARRLGVDLAAFGRSGVAIVGSNGKGSTAAMTEAALRAPGRIVGLFTSPHLLALNERFRVDGEDISDAELAPAWARVCAAIEAEGVASSIGAFEFLFLIAAHWFRARACTHTIWEAGIGGRLDPVRLIEAQALALTSLDLEHTELLGGALPEIAREKLAAAPRGADVFVGARCRAQGAEIEAYCEASALRLHWPSKAGSAPLPGDYQRENAGLALALAQQLTAQTPSMSALAGTRWSGRLEVLSREPLMVIDVGHTPAAVAAAKQAFLEMSRPAPMALVCGVSRDKAVAALVQTLAPDFSVVICAAAQHKGAPAAHVAQIAAQANPQAQVIAAESVADAYAVARRNGRTIYAAGGLFLAAEFKAVHIGRDPASLVFF